MSLASPFPTWLSVGLIAVAAVAAYGSYVRLITPLSWFRRLVLTGLRFLTFLTLLLFLAQPVQVEQAAVRRLVVPVLLDQSQSMGIPDADGEPRVEAAAALVNEHLIPVLGDDFDLDLWGFGDRLEPIELAGLRPEDGRSDLAGALNDIQARYVDQAVAAIIVVSDGGDTGGEAVASDSGPPVFTIGVGLPAAIRDREVLDLTAGLPIVADSFVDLSFSIVEHGFEGSPLDVRVFEDGQLIRALQITPSADGAITPVTVPISPRSDAVSLYTVAVQADPLELVEENNTRSVLVQPVGRPRRVLLVEGAPGYEHSFLKRALSDDAGIVVDAVIDKGQNDRGDPTFYIQGAAERTRALATGFPTTREALFVYDAVFLANVNATRLSSAQIEMLDVFVSERGGGLLVMGERSFERLGLDQTSLDALLPVTPVDRVDSRLVADSRVGSQRLELTRDGETHPIMRLGGSHEETRRVWEAVPSLGRVFPMGPPRSGATVLATILNGRGAGQPAIAVQRFGRGRTMVFAGEASWRWQMLLPSTDLTYERFWKQAARWLAVESPERVALGADGGRVEGDPLALNVSVVDEDFLPMSDAAVRIFVRDTSGRERELSAALAAGQAGRYRAELIPERPGIYELTAVAGRAGQTIGRSRLSVLVGGADLEMADPRRHDALLQRVAVTSGGKMIDPDGIKELRSALEARLAPQLPPMIHDLWDSIYGFLLVIGLLSAEWSCRRRWGLR